MIISCANIKGGVGKSCLAQNIAVSLLKRGSSVYLVDADSQETTADWIEERRDNPDLENIRFAKLTGKIREELLSIEEQFDIVVVDCGGHDSDTMRWSISASTHVLIPFRPKRRDLKLLPAMADLIDLITPVNPDCKFSAIITQAPTLPSQVKRILEAKEACRSFNISPLNTVIFHRNVYDDADESGSTVIEEESNGKAANEIEALIDELLGE
jgi:chromosome partitioning protein